MECAHTISARIVYIYTYIYIYKSTANHSFRTTTALQNTGSYFSSHTVNAVFK